MVSIDNATIHFGAKGMTYYTLHKDDKRTATYIARRRARENCQDINTAGFWSYWILWNQPTLNESNDGLNKTMNTNYKVFVVP